MLLEILLRLDHQLIDRAVHELLHADLLHRAWLFEGGDEVGREARVHARLDQMGRLIDRGADLRDVVLNIHVLRV